jgi:alpha-L-fucosidase 2
MKNIILRSFLLLCCIGVSAQGKRAIVTQPGTLKNIWTKPPSHIPNTVSIDAPLMGNGDVTMSVGYQEARFRYYLSKNDFWRLRSQADGLSGPRMVGFVDIKIEGFNDAAFTAEQLISNGITTCILNKNSQKIETKSWVSATENLIFIELKAIDKAATVSINLTAPENKQAKLETGKTAGNYWLTRAFADNVDISTEVAVALKTINYTGNTFVLKPGKKLVITLAIESKFKKTEPLEYVLGRVKKIDRNAVETLMQKHIKWWDTYWDKSSVKVEDTVLMKAYYQGLYTMAACSRDEKFPPGIFGWITTDAPAWNGDYHLNYNFQAPFYGLFAANRVEQGAPHDAPLIDFMSRGEWYAKNVTNTRGILYPVGIGPLGIEVTRNFVVGGYQKKGDIEHEGLFYGQRSNAAYGLINMAQHWRCTYDIAYGKKVYPYALAVANFWEDYLKFENGRYVIYGDAIHEGSGKDKNSVLSLGLVRNVFDLIIDLSSALKIDENRRAKWEDILTRLSEFPVQMRNGRKIFRYTEEGVDWWGDNGLGIQQIYPANAITLDSKEELLTVARNTIDEMQRWQDVNTSNSFFAAAIRVGYDPSVIINELHKYALHIYPNGFQLQNPHGIENSCTVANALNEMLCMSAGNVIRLFSVFPKSQNASFKNIRTWGAFLISARLTNGVVSDVKIISEKGMPCTIVNPWPGQTVNVIRNGRNAESLTGSRFRLKTKVNETLKLQPE